MSPLHYKCSRNEPYFLVPKGDMKRGSSFSVHFLTMKAQIGIKLRRSETVLLETQSCIEAARSWSCRDSLMISLELGVMLFSGSTFAGDATLNNIGRT